MVHLSIDKEFDYKVFDISQFSLSSIEEMSKDSFDMVYITRNNQFIGCIGKKELRQSIQEKKVVINDRCKYIVHSEHEIEQATELFNNNPYIKRLPIIDTNRHMMYEYTYSYEAYYDKLDIRDGISRGIPGRDEQIILSLTSYGKRLDIVHLVIKSLMCQSLKADKILLYLAEADSHDCLKDEEMLVNAGLEIIRGVKDIGPHKKYFFAMQDYPESVIITVDDDVLYDDNTIEKLYNKHLYYPDSVIGMSGHRMLRNGKKLLPYNQWELRICSEKPTFDAVATGIAGVLYPVGSYRDSFIDIQGLTAMCPMQDDLWLKTQELKNNIRTFIIGNANVHTIVNSQGDNALAKRNMHGGRNDICLGKLSAHYGIDFADFAKEESL